MSNVQFGSTAQPMSDTSRRPITNTLACTLREEVDGQWAVVWRAANVRISVSHILTLPIMS